MKTQPRVAIVYDRVNTWGGAERVLLSLHTLFPSADLFTSVYSPRHALWSQEFPSISTSFLQQFSFFRDKHMMIPFAMPFAFEQFDFSSYDLVLSVTSEAAKGIVTRPSTRHICYLLTPTRYLWSGYHEYFPSRLSKVISKPLINHIRRWDFNAAQRPDTILSISKEVQRRTKLYYGRSSPVIYPPVSVEQFIPKKKPRKDNYYLVVSRLVGYKRVDLAIEACLALQRPLRIVGTGRQERYLRRHYESSLIQFLGKVSDPELVRLYQHARAVFFPQYEDFGIVAVESQAAGTPVIAYGKGGATETIVSNKTGIFFDKQSVKSIINTLKHFETMSFDHNTLIENATTFSTDRFINQFSKVIYGL